VIISSAFSFLFGHCQHIVKFFASFLNIGPWGDNLGNFSLHDFSRDRVCGLLGNSDFVAVLNEFGDVFIYAMMRNSRHRDGMFSVFIFAREDEVKDFVANMSVFKKGFVEIPDTKKKHTVKVLLFHLLILLHCGGKLHR
jgi:hypothetical protein